MAAEANKVATGKTEADDVATEEVEADEMAVGEAGALTTSGVDVTAHNWQGKTGTTEYRLSKAGTPGGGQDEQGKPSNTGIPLKLDIGNRNWTLQGVLSQALVTAAA